MNRVQGKIYTVCVILLLLLILNTGSVSFPIWEFTDHKAGFGETIRFQAFMGMMPLYQYSFYQPVKLDVAENEAVLQDRKSVV